MSDKVGEPGKNPCHNFPESVTQALSEMMARGMKLHCTVQEGEVGMGDGQSHVELELFWLQANAGFDGAT